MSVYLRSLFVIFLALFSGQSSASETYVCTFTPLGDATGQAVGEIPLRVSMRFSQNGTSARVKATREGSAFFANLEQRGAGSYLLDWTTERDAQTYGSATTGSFQDRYRIVLNLKNMKVALQMLTSLSQDEVAPRAFGTCSSVEQLPRSWRNYYAPS
ncbi:hypothetical protein [Pseudophaeobacter sp.]|uniref:hypothetical protein n=1 Tax=Pseudophaeobacter sp. TaxID=1971739 RepID=UPI003A96A5B7